MFDLFIETPLGCRSITSTVLKNCPILIGDCKFFADLIPLNMHGVDVILGMYWLAGNYVTLDYFGKKIIFQQSGQPKYIFYSNQRVIPIQQSLAFNVEVISEEGMKLENISILCNFPEVFSKELR